jgi:ribulose-phosphate 3-epimerase
MEVIPVVNCEDRTCAEKKLIALSSFLESGHFIHVDVTDGVFTPHKTWNDASAWKELLNARFHFQLEVHLMVEHPTIWIMPWIAAGVKRFIVHVEAIDEISFKKIKELCDQGGATLMLSSNPETPIEAFSPYFTICNWFQVLSVHPGLAGQPFLSLTLEKTSWLRRREPHAIIEMDGGMNPETAESAKNAGADIIVSASDIFNNQNPKKEYERLKKI